MDTHQSNAIPPTTFEDSPDYIQSLHRGLEVIRTFDADHSAISLAEVAERVGLSRPVVRRLLMTLEHLGYVSRDGRWFSLTPRVLDLGFSYLSSLTVAQHALPFMEELHRVTRPGGTAAFRCPYGSTDDAGEDPTHVRRMFAGSWGYFGQPHYWKASYGYGGDWQPERVTLSVFPEFATCTDGELWSMIRFQRNIVAEMSASLRCVKPSREPLLRLQERPDVVLVRRRA